MRQAAIGAVRLYQWFLRPLVAAIDPAPGPRCKYHPSCSAYAVEALRRFGVARGLALAGWRLVRCNPWSHGGFDPVDGQRLFARRP